jgi:gliding motility-associated-like protein
VVTLNLFIKYSDHTTHEVTVCDSYTWEGTTYTTSNNSDTRTYTNMVGCDSVVTLNLTVNHNSSHTDSIAVCNSYTWDGVTYTTSGTYVNDYVDLNGCDSTVTVVLTVSTSMERNESVTLCEYDLPYQYNDTVFGVGTTSGVHDIVYTSQEGCDSIIHLRLNLYYGPITSNPEATIQCFEHQFRLIAHHTNDINTVTWSSVPEDPNLALQQGRDTIYVTPNVPTVYTVSGIVPDAGCHNSMSVNISALPSARAAMNIAPPYITADHPEVTVEDRSTGDIAWRRWYIDGYEAGSDYRFTYNYPNGPDSIQFMLVVADPEFGCEDTAVTYVYRRGGVVYAPSVFTPDEPNNNCFSVQIENAIQYRISIYARNGLLVYESPDIDGCWDGTVRNTGHACPQGSYIYVITYTTDEAPDTRESYRGSILLLR